MLRWKSSRCVQVWPLTVACGEGSCDAGWRASREGLAASAARRLVPQHAAMKTDGEGLMTGAERLERACPRRLYVATAAAGDMAPGQPRRTQMRTHVASLIAAALVLAWPATHGLVAGAVPGQTAQAPRYPTLPSETPDKFTPPTDAFDHVRRDVMIPMRDGVRLHTVILVPKGARNAPILL